jgi:hypothetical protein
MGKASIVSLSQRAVGSKKDTIDLLNTLLIVIGYAIVFHFLYSRLNVIQFLIIQLINMQDSFYIMERDCINAELF